MKVLIFGKGVRKRVDKYRINSQELISHLRAERLLKERGFVVNEKNVNCLFPSNGKESMKHWLVKAMLFKLLRNLNRRVGTEIETRTGIVDVVDIDKLIAYEIESELRTEKIEERLRSLWFMRDIFFIDIRRVPNDFAEAEEYLKRKIV